MQIMDSVMHLGEVLRSEYCRGFLGICILYCPSFRNEETVWLKNPKKNCTSLRGQSIGMIGHPPLGNSIQLKRVRRDGPKQWTAWAWLCVMCITCKSAETRGNQWSMMVGCIS